MLTSKQIQQSEKLTEEHGSGRDHEAYEPRSPFLEELGRPDNELGRHTRNLINMVEEAKEGTNFSRFEMQMVAVGFYLTLLTLEMTGHDMEVIRKQFVEGTFFKDPNVGNSVNPENIFPNEGQTSMSEFSDFLNEVKG